MKKQIQKKCDWGRLKKMIGDLIDIGKKQTKERQPLKNAYQAEYPFFEGQPIRAKCFFWTD